MDKVTIVLEPKSVGISIILTVLLGPLGILYSNVAGFFMILLYYVVAIALCAMGMGYIGVVLLLLGWLVTVLIGVRGVKKYNKSLKDGSHPLLQ